MYNQFNMQQFHILPTQCIYVFVLIWEQTAIISLYNINWLVCITETECVYCAVRTGSLYVIHIFVLNGLIFLIWILFTILDFGSYIL